MEKKNLIARLTGVLTKENEGSLIPLISAMLENNEYVEVEVYYNDWNPYTHKKSRSYVFYIEKEGKVSYPKDTVSENCIGRFSIPDRKYYQW